MGTVPQCGIFATRALVAQIDPFSRRFNEAITVRDAYVAYVAAGGSARYSDPLLYILGDKPLAEIDQADIDRAADIIGTGKKHSTIVRQVHTPLSAVLKYGASRGWCPYRRVRRPRIEPCDKAAPSEHIVGELCKAASPIIRRIIRFITGTGLSGSETLRLEWPQIDLDRRRLRRASCDGRPVQWIALSDQAVECLQKCRSREGRVFRRADGRAYGGKHGSGSFKTALRGACKRAGIQPVTSRMLQKVWHERQNRRRPDV